MKLKITDLEVIERKRCEKKGCNKVAEGIYNGKFLCRYHWKEIKPDKETRTPWSSFGLHNTIN